MEFLNIYAILGIVIIPFIVMMSNKKIPFSKETADKLVIKGKISKKTKFYILTAAYILMLTALARPVINNGYTTIKAPEQNLVIALDISRIMDKTDLYPNREEFAKNKIIKLLDMLKNQNTAIILFDAHSYLISPPSKDYDSLKYLLKHTDIKDLKRSPLPDIRNMLESAKEISKNPKIVIFTAVEYTPTDKNTFVYLCKKEKTDIPNVYNAEFSNDNLKKLSKQLNSSKYKEMKIQNNTELFYYPLALAILLILFVIFFPLRRIK